MPEITSPAAILLLWAVIGYLLGSIPTGVILARVMGLGDLRQIGSGNIGATNVLRTGNKKAAALTLLGDALKGAAAVLLARSLAAPDAVQLAALAAFLGHCFPVWLKFRGGKGVATFLGVLLALTPLGGLIACAIWALTAWIGRMSSLAALLAAGWTPVVVLLIGQHRLAVLTLVLAILVYARHAANIRRLRTGTEPKFGRKT